MDNVEDEELKARFTPETSVRVQCVLDDGESRRKEIKSSYSFGYKIKEYLESYDHFIEIEYIMSAEDKIKLCERIDSFCKKNNIEYYIPSYWCDQSMFRRLFWLPFKTLILIAYDLASLQRVE